MDTQSVIDEALTRLRDEIIRNSTLAGQKATGRTYAKIQKANVTDVHGELVGPKHISILEDGRRPGKVPYNFEEILKEWAEAKGLHFDSYYAIAKKIREEGTALYRSGGRRDIFEPAIENFKTWISEKLVALYKAEFINELRTTLKK